MLVCKDVSKFLGSFKALENCNLVLEKGSVLGLIGPNGAGKSTLLRCISDVYQCDTGVITWDSEVISNNPSVKSNILLLSDDPYYSMNTCIDDMKEFYKVFYPSFDEDIYNKYLSIFRLDRKKSMKNFSKGMKRQAFIVFALAISPSLLLLDEAFDGLDPLNRLIFKRAINELLLSKDMTIIISSHNLRELEDICDCFAILDNKTITTKGDIQITKDNIHKIQMVFNEEKDISEFKDFSYLDLNISKRVVTMVAEGDYDSIVSMIESMNPLMYDVLDISLEELFLYKIGSEVNDYV